MTKEQIEKENKEIVDAILVSQMMDSDGFKVFENWLAKEIDRYRIQDIREIKDLKYLYENQGIVNGLEMIKTHLFSMKRIAMKPMTDPETGEKEFLNKRN